MPEATSAGGGYSCQVCGTTYPTESELIQYGREQHPDKPVSWGDPRETSTIQSETQSRASGSIEEMADKIKAGAKAAGEKVAHPEKDLKAEYEQKKTKERGK